MKTLVVTLLVLGLVSSVCTVQVARARDGAQAVDPKAAPVGSLEEWLMTTLQQIAPGSAEALDDGEGLRLKERKRAAAEQSAELSTRMLQAGSSACGIPCACRCGDGDRRRR